jgi:ABC-type transport system involved in multi-copper enzyme maturation permease subunit
MNIVTHIFKKDLRHNRVLLVVWLVLLAVQYGLVGVTVNPGDEVMQSLYETISNLTPELLILLMIVLIPLLVHDEPLVGTTAFWFTRPISRTDLLKSKTLFVLLVLTLPPLAGETIVLAANGATGHDLLLAAPEIVMEGLAIVLCVGLLAVVTSNFGRFAIAVAVTWVSLFLAAMVISWVQLLLRTKGILGQQSYNPTLEQSREVVSLLLTILAGGAVIAHQYLSRNTYRTIAGMVVGLVLVTAVMIY